LCHHPPDPPGDLGALECLDDERLNLASGALTSAPGQVYADREPQDLAASRQL